MVEAGDLHNFGRRVKVNRKGLVTKPRTIFWEELLLSPRSRFRMALRKVMKENSLTKRDFLPELKFRRSGDGQSGKVFSVHRTLKALGRTSQKEKLELASATGELVALSTWLGLADLHQENLFVGRSKDGKFRMGPLDVEMILFSMSLPHDTMIVPNRAPEDRSVAGLRIVFSSLGEPLKGPYVLAMLEGYVNFLNAIEAHQTQLLRALRHDPRVETMPIRYLLRATHIYDDFLTRGQRPIAPFVSAEMEQLNRGEIPYFFITLKAPEKLRYYDSQDLASTQVVSTNDIRRATDRTERSPLKPLFSIHKGWTVSKFRAARTLGSAIFLSSIDHQALNGRIESSTSEIQFLKTKFELRMRSISISAPRLAGQLAGSAYKTKR